MSNKNQQPKEPNELLPQTAFMLVKSGQNFANLLLSQPKKTDSAWMMLCPRDTVPGEAVDEKSTAPLARYFELQYTERDKFLGELHDWDAQLFSFKDHMTDGEASFNQLFITLPLENVDHPALEVSYRLGRRENDNPSGVEVVIPFEGIAKIKEQTLVDKGNGTWGPEGEWRPMTDNEGMSLLADLNELTERLEGFAASDERIGN